jgi:hypothetical protein
MEKQFIKTDKLIYRRNEENGLHVRLISDEVILYTDLTREEMIKLRDFLNEQIVDSFWQRAGSL